MFSVRELSLDALQWRTELVHTAVDVGIVGRARCLPFTKVCERQDPRCYYRCLEAICGLWGSGQEQVDLIVAFQGLHAF